MATLPLAEPLNATPPRPFRVLRRSRETADTFTLELAAVDGCPLRAAPGQFTMLYALGVGEVPISISGDPAKPERLVHTVRAVGPVTSTICSSRKGALLGVRGPLGNTWPVAEARGRDVVIVAGGIGLAPLRSALYQVLRHREDYRYVVLLYGGRTPGDLLYRRELEHWRGRLDAQVEVTVDAAAADWHGRVGVVTELIPRAEFDAASAVALVCGPELMMRFTARALLDRGVAGDSIYLSMERNMRCGVGHCGHCQLGPALICLDGPVFRYDRIEPWMAVREL